MNVQALADFCSSVCEGVGALLIYRDGVELWLAVTKATQRKIRRKIERKLGSVVVAEARSKDGFGGVLIVKPKDWESAPLAGYPAFTPDTYELGELVNSAIKGELFYNDNRERDMNTLEVFSEWLTDASSELNGGRHD